MLSPKIIQLPDYSEYIDKEFIVLEDIDMSKTDLYRPILKGTRFIIKKINNSQVTIKISNSKEELENLGMLDYDFNRVISDKKKEINILKKVYKMWVDEPHLFIVDEENFWNEKDNKGRRGHCINTGYQNIPFDHPDKFGMAEAYYDDKGKYANPDTIMTINYKRIDNKTNLYSYQSGKNEFYSKNCYDYMIKGIETDLNDWKNKIDYYKKWVFGWIFEKREISIKTLNKMNFELYKKKP